MFPFNILFSFYKVRGTRASLLMDLKYWNKANYMNEAARLIDQHPVTGMTQQQIQEEIFGHAATFYNGPVLVNYIGMHGVVGGMAAAAAVAVLMMPSLLNAILLYSN